MWFLTLQTFGKWSNNSLPSSPRVSLCARAVSAFQAHGERDAGRQSLWLGRTNMQSEIRINLRFVP